MNRASKTTQKRLSQKPARRKVERTLSDRVKITASKVESLFTDLPKHINTAIKTDHDGLRHFLKILKDTDQDMKVRRSAYTQFASLLESHSEAEEKAVYQMIRALPGRELHIKIAEGFSEHLLASDLMERIGNTKDPINWSGHTNVLAEILEHHLKEEERDLFPMINDEMDAKLNDEMLAQYIFIRGKTQKKIGKDNAGVLEAMKGQARPKSLAETRIQLQG